MPRVAASLYALALLASLPRVAPGLENGRYLVVGLLGLAALALVTPPLALAGRRLGQRPARRVPSARRRRGKLGAVLAVSAVFLVGSTALFAALLHAAEVQEGYEGRRRTCALVEPADGGPRFVIYDEKRDAIWKNAEIGRVYGPFVVIGQRDPRAFDDLFANGFDGTVAGHRLELFREPPPGYRRQVRVDGAPARMRGIGVSVD